MPKSSRSGRLTASSGLRASGSRRQRCWPILPEQIIIEKDDLDLFSNPTVLPLLDRLGIDECFVYGVYLEYCVKCAVMGLLKSGRKVRLVTNATMAVDPSAGDAVVRDFIAAGGQCVSL